MLRKTNHKEYELITNKYDFYINQIDNQWVIDVFDHNIEDNQNAYLYSFNTSSFSEAKEEIKNYV